MLTGDFPGHLHAPADSLQYDLHEDGRTHSRRNNLRFSNKRTQTIICTPNPSPSKQIHGGSILNLFSPKPSLVLAPSLTLPATGLYSDTPRKTECRKYRQCYRRGLPYKCNENPVLPAINSCVNNMRDCVD